VLIVQEAMGSGQSGCCCVTQDAQPREHLSTRQQPTDTNPLDVDESYMSPEVRAILAQGAQETGLEVDGDGDDEADTAGEDEDNARSVYAMSMYPGVQPAHQVEHPYENGHDSATMWVSPFLTSMLSERRILTTVQRLRPNAICRGF
jgi:hypothetical protein